MTAFAEILGIAREMGIPVRRLTGPGRAASAHITSARRVCVQRLTQRMSVAMAARHMGLHHTTVLWLLGRVQ